MSGGEAGKAMRLDRLLSEAGWGSRAEVRGVIRGGRATVDGRAVSDPALRIDPRLQSVRVDGRDAEYRAFDYLMLHKPAGVVSATEDPREDTVLSLLPPRYQRRGLFPAGRLDKDATGLLLLTNDGALAHRLTAPGRGTPRTYEVTVDGPLGPEDVRAFSRGLSLPGGETCRPAELAISEEPGAYRAFVTLCEGKYHQVKRMFAARRRTVLSLKRVSHGPLRLDGGLAPGAWRPLTEAERLALLQHL